MCNLIDATPLRNCVKILSASLAVVVLASCANLRGPAYKLAQEDDASFGKPLREPKEVNTDFLTLQTKKMRTQVQKS